MIPTIWKKRLVVLLLGFFCLSMEGVSVIAQEILDTPDTQTGFKDPAATPDEPETTEETPAPTDESLNEDWKDPDLNKQWVAKELVTFLETCSDEVVIVDNIENYDIPASEVSAGTGRQGPCGPFSMTSALKGRGEKISYGTVLDELKPLDLYTAPMEMVRYAIGKGYGCQRHDNQKVQKILDIIRETKQSVIVMVHTSYLTRNDDGTFKIDEERIQHWLNIVGGRIRKGKPFTLFMKDSAWSNGSGAIREMPADEFDFRWKEMVGIQSLGINPKRMIVEMRGKGSVTLYDRLASYFEILSAGEVAAEGVGNGYRAIGNIWKDLKDLKFGSVVVNVAHLAVAIPKILSGVAGFIVEMGGVALDKAGDWVNDKAKGLWENGGVLGKIAAVPLYAIGGALNIAGGILKIAGNLIANIGNQISNVIDGVIDTIANVGKKIIDTINPANWF